MDRDLPGILALWLTTVTSFQWDDPADPHRFTDKSGFGPTAWRTAQLQEVHHPLFCTKLIKAIKGMLHRRLRHNLEQIRLQGKIGRVIRSTLHLFTLESLRIPDQGTLMDQRVTEHFRLWYENLVHPLHRSMHLPPTRCHEQHTAPPR